MSEIITVVSGLPRSGTSMMMRFLMRLGLPLLVSNHRAPDLHNPLGYFEYDRVKSLAHDTAWLAEARGKVVKIVAPLIETIPRQERYRIIYMRRALDHVIASQQHFTAAAPSAGSLEDLAQAYGFLETRVLADLRSRKEVTLREVSFEDALRAPAAAARAIASFLSLDPVRAEALAEDAFRPDLVHYR